MKVHIGSPRPDTRGERAASLPLHDAQDLTEGGQQAQILLHDQIYTLRITRQGKLLLTK